MSSRPVRSTRGSLRAISKPSSTTVTDLPDDDGTVTVDSASGAAAAAAASQSSRGKRKAVGDTDDNARSALGDSPSAANGDGQRTDDAAAATLPTAASSESDAPDAKRAKYAAAVGQAVTVSPPAASSTSSAAVAISLAAAPAPVFPTPLVDSTIPLQTEAGRVAMASLLRVLPGIELADCFNLERAYTAQKRLLFAQYIREQLLVKLESWVDQVPCVEIILPFLRTMRLTHFTTHGMGMQTGWTSALMHFGAQTAASGNRDGRLNGTVTVTSNGSATASAVVSTANSLTVSIRISHGHHRCSIHAPPPDAPSDHAQRATVSLVDYPPVLLSGADSLAFHTDDKNDTCTSVAGLVAWLQSRLPGGLPKKPKEQSSLLSYFAWSLWEVLRFTAYWQYHQDCRYAKSISYMQKKMAEAIKEGR